MSKKEASLVVGFVGAGWMGAAQLKQLAGRPGVEVKTLCEPNTERGRQALVEAGLRNTQLVSDYEPILADETIDAVWLVSPNAHHGPQAIQALEAGKHVFCEKPPATRLEQFTRQIELERSHPGLITFVDYILYFDPMERRLRRMVADGLFGELTQVQVNYRHPVNTAGDKAWKLRRDVMGDAIGMGINHAISVLLWIMQANGASPVSVFATSQSAKVRGFEADPIWSIQIRFDNDASGFCFGNIDSGNGYDAYHNLFGTEGGFVFDSGLDRAQKVRFWSKHVADGEWVYPLNESRCREQGATPWPDDTTTPDSGDVIHHQIGEAITHFLDCVTSRTPSPLSFANAATIGQIGWAAQVSAMTNRPVRLPLNEASQTSLADHGRASQGSRAS